MIGQLKSHTRNSRVLLQHYRLGFISLLRASLRPSHDLPLFIRLLVTWVSLEHHFLFNRSKEMQSSQICGRIAGFLINSHKFVLNCKNLERKILKFRK